MRPCFVSIATKSKEIQTKRPSTRCTISEVTMSKMDDLRTPVSIQHVCDCIHRDVSQVHCPPSFLRDNCHGFFSWRKSRIAQVGATSFAGDWSGSPESTSISNCSMSGPSHNGATCGLIDPASLQNKWYILYVITHRHHHVDLPMNLPIFPRKSQQCAQGPSLFHSPLAQKCRGTHLVQETICHAHTWLHLHHEPDRGSWCITLIIDCRLHSDAALGDNPAAQNLPNHNHSDWDTSVESFSMNVKWSTSPHPRSCISLG